MKKLIVILLLCSSCVSTEKLLQTKSKNEVSVIEQKRFARKNTFKTRRQWRVISIGVFMFAAIVINNKEEK